MTDIIILWGGRLIVEGTVIYGIYHYIVQMYKYDVAGNRAGWLGCLILTILTAVVALALPMDWLGLIGWELGVK